MKKKLLNFFLFYILFFHLIHVALDVPNFIDGYVSFPLFTTDGPTLFKGLLEFVVTFALALSAYFCLHYIFAKKRAAGLFFLSSTFALIFISHFQLLPAIHDNEYTSVFRLLLIFAFILYGAGFSIWQNTRNYQKQRTMLAFEKRQAELSFLRSQIHPHFLFNSLNNIYSLVYDKSPGSLQAISDLSELMRYMIYTNSEKVPLIKELLYIEKYIGLQKLRFGHPIKSQIQFDGVDDKVLAPPLLFIPFVENAFKHGDFSSPDTGIELECTVNPNHIHFTSKNKIRESGPKEEESGIGLENVKKRLELLYPGNYTLRIFEANRFFNIQLTIPHEQ